MSHEGRRGKRKHRAGHGACSYCGRVHKKGKRRGDSCRGHGRMTPTK
jgi:hypothetical protein